MKIFLTGGLGYVGGRLVQDLSRAGMQVVLGSRRTAAPPVWLPEAHMAVTDWGSHAALVAACKDVDVVIHLAGMNARDCARDPAGALQVNGLNTANLVAAAVEAGVRRFIYFSTAHVYASPLAGHIAEDSCPRNLHPYATSHRAGEDAVRFANSAGTIEGVVIRLSNSFGAPASVQADCWTLVANDLAKQLATTGAFALDSAGGQVRDFIALSEVSRITLAMLALPAERFETDIFNLGSGFSMSIIALAERIGKRYEVLYGRKPALSVPSASIGRDERFSYGISSLGRAGIALPSVNSIDAEIDRLLRFCIDTFG